MPDRIIRESALLSPTLEKLSAEAERLFWRLTLVADDYGRFDADPRAVVSRALPLLAPRIALKDAATWFAELIEAGLVVVYHVGERIIASFRTWSKYQRSRDSRPKYPAPNEGEGIDTSQYLSWANGTRPTYPQYPQPLAARARAIESREPYSESREARDESRGSRVERRTPAPPAADVPPPRARPPRASSRSVSVKVPTSGEGRAPGQPSARARNGTPAHVGAELRTFMAKLRAVAGPHAEI